MAQSKKVFLKADTLGIGKTQTIRYLTHIHSHLINCNHTRIKLTETLEMIHINFNNACKHNISIPNVTNDMTDSGNKPTVQCPSLQFSHYYQNWTGQCTKQNGCHQNKMQCQKSCTSPEFIFQAANKMESQGQGKLVPAGLANVIGKKTTMQH